MNNPEENVENTDDQWWEQQDEEQQQHERVSLLDRAKAIGDEALGACDNDISQAFGRLSMFLALDETLALEKDKAVLHLKECIKILEKR